MSQRAGQQNGLGLRRRAALKAALAPVVIPARLLRGQVAPSNRLQIGFIGVGGMGTGHVKAFLNFPDVRVTAVCDVRQSHRERAGRLVDQAYGAQACATYKDFRELLDREDIDAVCMAVPDHWHVIIGLEAARRGKHIYFEKPLGMSIAEGRAMRAAVRRYGVVFQFGTQQRSSENYRRAAELVRSGRLGEIKRIMIGSATAPPNPQCREEAIPAELDYDMWLGPAPLAPYCSERCSRNWTHIRDYSLGCLSGAWGIHDVDSAQWILDMDHTVPVTTEAWGVFPREGLFDTAESWEAIHTYANGVQLVHMDMPTALKRAWQFRLSWRSMLIEGTKGWILVSRTDFHCRPERRLNEIVAPEEEHVIFSNDHRRNFLNAIRTGSQPISPIEAAVHADFVCHHADIAMRLGRKLRWDRVREEFIDDPEANRLSRRPMRSPWTI